jgi:hypothetical protein
VDETFNDLDGDWQDEIAAYRDEVFAERSREDDEFNVEDAYQPD